MFSPTDALQISTHADEAIDAAAERLLMSAAEVSDHSAQLMRTADSGRPVDEVDIVILRSLRANTEDCRWELMLNLQLARRARAQIGDA